jgi:hypothetical protein
MSTEKKASTKAATAEAKSTTAKKTSSKAPKAASASIEGSSGAPRHEMIAEAAYYYAEKRGFQGGSPDEDWFRAEQDIQRLFS